MEPVAVPPLVNILLPPFKGELGLDRDDGELIKAVHCGGIGGHCCDGPPLPVEVIVGFGGATHKPVICPPTFKLPSTITFVADILIPGKPSTDGSTGSIVPTCAPLSYIFIDPLLSTVSICCPLFRVNWNTFGE